SCSWCYGLAFLLNYSLSLHDALPIFLVSMGLSCYKASGHVSISESELIPGSSLVMYGGEIMKFIGWEDGEDDRRIVLTNEDKFRSEEHTSELQSRENLVCHHLLEKKR